MKALTQGRMYYCFSVNYGKLEMSIDIHDIEIFSQIHESRRDKIDALFTSRNFEQGAVIIRYGEAVEGLYLLDHGEVEISIPGFEGVLATLGEGKSFGELSLFSDHDLASATVTVVTDSAELLFCPRESGISEP